MMSTPKLDFVAAKLGVARLTLISAFEEAMNEIENRRAKKDDEIFNAAMDDITDTYGHD